jgi:CRISPR-associated protein Cas1
MNELLNVLYVQAQGAVLKLDHDAVRVDVDGELRLRVPLLRLASIVAFGQVTITSFLIERCAEDGRSIVWLDRRGRFKARIEGPTRGNVLLRQAQYRAADDPVRTLEIARRVVVAKLHNSRALVMRAARDTDEPAGVATLARVGERLARAIERTGAAPGVAELRGIEGDAARAYFEAVAVMIRAPRDHFPFDGRTKRPPRDRTNALMSFLYALWLAECTAALEGVGLDPQVGYLHVVRPGRPALALDVLEEYRAAAADRLALRLINRRQLRPEHFEDLVGGSVNLTEDGRRIVIQAFQERKLEEVQHTIAGRKVPLGLVPHLQARLLARHLRGDLRTYPPFVIR